MRLLTTTSRAISARRRKDSALAEHLYTNGRAYISGMLPIIIGFASGWAAVLIAGGIAYYGAAQAAVDSLAHGGVGLFAGILRGIWVNASAYFFIAAGGLFWPIAPLSALFLALWAFPAGCAMPLLFALGVKGAICAVLCVIIPLLLALPIFLRAWAAMLRGARASLHNEHIEGYVKTALQGALWLIPVCLVQCVIMPLLFRGICALFFYG